jgi:hypothetical protein
MIKVDELKLNADGSYADRSHYIMNKEKYIEYWASLPYEYNYTTVQKIKRFFYNRFKKGKS